MFNLTLQEQCLLAAILVAMVTGALVKHWRDLRRQAQPPAVAAPAPGHRGAARPR